MGPTRTTGSGSATPTTGVVDLSNDRVALCTALLSGLREICDAELAVLDLRGGGGELLSSTAPSSDELSEGSIEERLLSARAGESDCDQVLRGNGDFEVAILGSERVSGDDPRSQSLESLLDLIEGAASSESEVRSSSARFLSKLTRQAVVLEDRASFEAVALKSLHYYLNARTVALVCLRSSRPRVLRLAGEEIPAEELDRAVLARSGTSAFVPQSGFGIGDVSTVGCSDQPLVSSGVCTGLGCPVPEQSECDGSVGVLWCKPSGSRPFEEDQVEAVRGVAHLIGLVTQRQEAQERLRQESKLAQTTLASIADAVLRIDSEGVIEFANEAAQRLTGQPTRALIGRNLGDLPFFVGYSGALVHDPMAVVHRLTQGRGSGGSFVLRGRRGDLNELDVQVSPIRGEDGQTECTVITLSDVTESRRMARELRHQASHDPLSGLINRLEFDRQVTEATVGLAEGETHVVCFLDLDQFKVVNDSAGHAAGDQMIRQLAGILRNCLRRSDTIGRLGGDEFGVLLRHSTAEEARRVGRSILDAVEDYRFRWEDKTFQVGVSIGLVEIDSCEWPVSQILSAADRACFDAKDKGRHRLSVASSVACEGSPPSGDIQWVPRIQAALEEGRFELFGQPIHAILERGTRATAFEVLIRKRDVDGQLVPPGAFLPAAERYHFANRIDRWTLRETLRVLSQNAKAFSRAEFCTINLSGQSIGDAEFLEFAVNEVRSSDVPSHQIGFEITETAAIANLAVAREFMDAMRELGCSFLLDDFGAGLSSFAYLKELPVDIIKIDGRFVRDMCEEPVDFAMVRSIHEIAALTQKRTVAEHAEDDATIDLLRALGVQYAQGFELGRPEPIADLLDHWPVD